MRKPCLHPGCPNQAKPGDPRCVDHAQEHDAGIARAGRNVYWIKRWRILRHRKLFTDPICEVCDNALATEVHHRTPLAEDDSDGNAYGMAGLVSICSPCHSQATKAEQLRSPASRSE
jgi:5-methylcytosine-specific restriction endonuclease McrA